MELAVEQRVAVREPWTAHFDVRAGWIWALTATLVLYLGLSGGGYDLVVRSDAAVIVWWVVLLGALTGVLPRVRATRAGWAALTLFAGFVVWTAIASTWSISSERSLAELSRVAGYLGVLVLAAGTFESRARAIRHVVLAAACASVILIGLAVLSRLRPGLFPAARTTAALLPGTHARLDWPLNYWNALGALVALTLPLLFAIATTARRLAVQAIAAAALPLTALCGYLTFSRGGAIASAVALVVFLLVVPERIQKCATLMLCAAGGAALIAGAAHRHAVEQGLTGPVADHQGLQLMYAVVLVCSGVALGQVAIGLAARHATLPRALQVPPGRAARLLAAGIVVILVLGLAAGAPSRLNRAWQQFKRPTAATLHSDTLSRFGALSGNGRYTYWKTSIDVLPGHVLGGYGPGTFQLVWLPRAPFYSYVRNAHSLYIETLLETGVVGLALLGGFILIALWAAGRAAARSHGEQRVYAAGIAASLVAFAVSAAFDWIWQVPVLPVIALLLASAAFLPVEAAADTHRTLRQTVWSLLRRGALVVVAVAALAAVGVPLALTNSLRLSQAEAATGDVSVALADARRALAIEPHSASAELQVALLLEVQHRIPAAVRAAHRAIDDEPDNWQSWLVLSRLSAESGNAPAALAAFRRSRALNPRSSLFQG